MCARAGVHECVFAPCRLYGTVRANGETDFILCSVRNSHLIVKWRFIIITIMKEEEEKKKKQKSRSRVGRLSSQIRFLKFYFCTCTFEYYQLQLKYPPRISRVSHRDEECNTCIRVVW